MNNNEILILALFKIKGIGRKAVIDYIDRFGVSFNSIESIVSNVKALAEKNKRIVIPSVEQMKAFLDESKRTLVKQEEQGVFAINITSDEYPSKFKEIADPPAVIYVKGDRTLLEGKRHIAIIGTREVSDHGAKAGMRLAGLLSEKGEIIVSGLAVGCDTCGHMGCLDAGGKTIAILPSPITNIMPKVNEKLAERILDEGGLLITEYPDGSEVQRGYYVERDRLQSALSDGVVVIETDVQGGTMHTVGFCQKHEKILACYKHPEKYNVLNQTRGNQMLIAEGKAMPLGSIEEIDAFMAAVEKHRNRRENTKTIVEQGEQISMLGANNE